VGLRDTFLKRREVIVKEAWEKEGEKLAFDTLTDFILEFKKVDKTETKFCLDMLVKRIEEAIALHKEGKWQECLDAYVEFNKQVSKSDLAVHLTRYAEGLADKCSNLELSYDLESFFVSASKLSRVPVSDIYLRAAGKLVRIIDAAKVIDEGFVPHLLKGVVDGITYINGKILG